MEETDDLRKHRKLASAENNGPNIIEQTSQSFGETVQVRFDPAGGVTVVPGSISHGQGHETMYKILVSHRLGIDADLIRVARNDTDVAADGGGTFASRTAVLGGSAVTLAVDKIIDKGKRIAAHLLEAAVADIEFGNAVFRVAGTDRRVTLTEVVQAAFRRPMIPADMETQAVPRAKPAAVRFSLRSTSIFESRHPAGFRFAQL